MNCKKCGKKGDIKFVEGFLCSGCFLQIIEKRVRKYVRLNKFFSKGDKILVCDELSEFLIRDILNGLPIEIVRRKVSKNDVFSDKTVLKLLKTKKITKVVFSWTADDESSGFLGGFLEGRLADSGDARFVKLLRNISEEDAAVFAKLNGIKFERSKFGRAHQLIEQISKNHPDVKYGLLRAGEKLDKTTGE